MDNITVLCGNSRKLVRNAKSITDATFALKKQKTGWLLTKLSPWFRVVCIDHAGKRA